MIADDAAVEFKRALRAYAKVVSEENSPRVEAEGLNEAWFGREEKIWDAVAKGRYIKVSK